MLSTVLRRHLGSLVYKWVLWSMVVAGLMIWSYVLGIEVMRAQSLETVYSQYYHIRIFEDGSYEGETIEGTLVAGCIKGALCDE